MNETAGRVNATRGRPECNLLPPSREIACVKSNQSPPLPQPQPLRTIVVPISALQQQSPLPEGVVPVNAGLVYVIPGARDKRGYGHRQWGQVQWVMFVIVKYCQEEFQAQHIKNKSRFTVKVRKILTKIPNYRARGFRKLPSRRTVMRAWKRVRVEHGLDTAG